MDALVEKITKKALKRRYPNAKTALMRIFDGLRDMEETPRPQKMVEELSEPHPLAVEAEW